VRGFVGARNLFKLWFLLFLECAALGGLGWLFGGFRLLPVFVFAGLLLALAVYWYADRAVLGTVGARELPVGQSPALHATVEGIAARAAVAKPRLYVIPDAYPRALAAGRGPGGAAIAVSAGLLTTLSPAELEGVIAHEIAHIRHRDVLVQSSVFIVAFTLVELSRVGGFLQRALLFVLGPIAAAFVHLLLSSQRELLADAAAARLCDSPHGLADALLRLDHAAELVDFRASPVTEPLYTINPFAEEGLAALFVTHPPVGDRVARLRRLDPSWPEKLRAA
jgi:heat shock protein HtpX